jgi:hypothetical protein
VELVKEKHEEIEIILMDSEFGDGNGASAAKQIRKFESKKEFHN